MAPSSPVLETVVDVPRLAPRQPDSHKGTFGRLLVVAGSRGMSGAAVLCGSAGLRGGAGLVRVAVPADILSIVAAANPCYLTAPLPSDRQGQLAPDALKDVSELLAGQDAVALGPGLGHCAAVTAVVLAVLHQIRVPLVLDADGLNAVVGQTGRLKGRPAPVILTPHPGEFARLLGCDTADVQADRQKLAVRFAGEHGVILVLKGHATLVTDGRRFYQNTTGNPGMATGGTGDVLTGLIAALLCQGLDAFAAAQLGGFVHGRAGDLARDELGEVSLIASDLLDYLPRALRQL